MEFSSRIFHAALPAQRLHSSINSRLNAHQRLSNFHGRRSHVSTAALDTDADSFFDPLPSQSPSSSQANCYGCGVALQTSNEEAAGYVDLEKFELKRKHRQLHQLLCSRCQALSNGSMIPGVADFQQLIASENQNSSNDPTDLSSRQVGYSAKTLATPEQLREQLRGVRRSRALVVLLIDLLDASGSMLGKVRDLVGANPIIAVGTKFDLLPAGTDPLDVEDWLTETLAYKRITTESVHVVSSRTGGGVAAAVAAVRKSRLGRDVYIMGAANVGKSSFVRALVKDMSSMKSRQYDPLAPGRAKHLPVESAMPGTTLKTIPLEVFSSGGVLYDTPGLHLHHRVPHILTPEENKELHPRKRLKGYVVAPGLLQQNPAAGTHEEAAGVSYLWGGLARIDVLSCPEDAHFVFYGPPALRVVPLQHSEDNQAQQQDALFGSTSVDLRGGLRVSRVVEMKITGDKFESIGDLALSGVPGWISVVAGPSAKQQQRRFSNNEDNDQVIRVKVWAPVGVEVFARPPFPVALPDQLKVL